MTYNGQQMDDEELERLWQMSEMQVEEPERITDFGFLCGIGLMLGSLLAVGYGLWKLGAWVFELIW